VHAIANQPRLYSLSGCEIHLQQLIKLCRGGREDTSPITGDRGCHDGALVEGIT
jgi:hypothetical protein